MVVVIFLLLLSLLLLFVLLSVRLFAEFLTKTIAKFFPAIPVLTLSTWLHDLGAWPSTRGARAQEWRALDSRGASSARACAGASARFVSPTELARGNSVAALVESAVEELRRIAAAAAEGPFAKAQRAAFEYLGKAWGNLLAAPRSQASEALLRMARYATDRFTERCV